MSINVGWLKRFLKIIPKKFILLILNKKTNIVGITIYIKGLTFEQHRTLLIAELKSAKQMVENYA